MKVNYDAKTDAAILGLVEPRHHDGPALQIGAGQISVHVVTSSASRMRPSPGASFTERMQMQ